MAQVVREAVSAYVKGAAGREGATLYEDEQSMDAILSIPQTDPTPEEMNSLEQNPLFQIIGVASGRTAYECPPEESR